MKYIIFFAILFCICKISFAQDIIFKTNGDEIEAKVLEVGQEIKYKMFKYQDGPTYILNKSEVFMIKYPDGHKDVFSNTSNSTNNNSEVKKEDVVANNFINSGNSQLQPEQNNYKVTNISNPNFKVMHNEIFKSTPSNKEQMDKLVISLEDAILKDDLKKAWEILDQIKKLN